MPVSQSRLLICLLASLLVSTTGLADSVIVNTTVDENNIDNQSCSLREAVSYLNAKNTKKALIDAEVSIIAGTSNVLNANLSTARQDLATEQAKATPDSSKITQLNNTINDLIIKIDAGLVGLNRKLDETNDALDKEKSKATPDAALITAYEASITELKAKIKIKEEEKTAKTNELKEYRSKGLFGCFSYDDSSSESILMLTLPKPYLLDTSLTINLSVAIKGSTISTSTDGTVNNLENSTLDLPLRPIIKANGNHQLLIINDGIDNTLSAPPIFVTFTNIDFIGCEQFCAANGGIILNKEALSITKGVISKGQANYGGAIYNAETASLLIKQSIFKENQATNDGAAIYSTDNNISLDATLVTQNKTASGSSGIITINSDTINQFSLSAIPYINNSTLSGNEGSAISSYGNMALNNNTIVNNTIGIRLNNKLPLIYNSIIAGNTQADCDLFAPLPSDNNIYFANNLSVQNKGCPSAFAANHNVFITNTGDETLMAPLDSNNRCAAPPALGLLCPLGEFGGLTKTHKPRLLASYTKLSDSPIVNKGFYNLIGNFGISCNTTDQRGLARENNENRCDIGAVEIQAGLGSYTQGDDIVYGQIKRFSPFANLADAELLPASYCSSVLGVGEYLNGCIKLIDLPTHGLVKFDALNSDILYSTYNADFHGFDKFSYGVVTTLSRFSDAVNDRALKINVKVVSEPPESLATKSLDNGSMNIFSLLILSSLLVVWRRPR